MTEEKSDKAPEDLLTAFDQIDDWLEEIDKQEDEAINKIYTRFCLLKGLPIDFTQVRRQLFADNPNYWTYWYRHGKPDQFFLMSRELKVREKDGRVEPYLNIIFSGELIKET